jgi:hypothetical protein
VKISTPLWETQAKLMAADVAFLASVTPPKVVLVAAPFTPGSGLVDPSTLTECSFTGGEPKPITAGTQQVFYDQVSGNYCLFLKEPAGGWTWVCSAIPAQAETIYGYALVTADDALVLGSELLADPVSISAVGQAVVLPNIRLTFNTSSPY